MKTSLSLKMLLRSPLRTLLTLLLLAAVSFGLLTRMCEYAVTKREMSRVMSYYRGVAALDTGVPNTLNLSNITQIKDDYHWGKFGLDDSNWRPSALTDEYIDSIASLPQVTSLDIRYMTAGISDSYERIANYAMYSEGYNYSSRFVMEATFDGFTVNQWNERMLDLSFSDYKFLAGPKDLMKEGKQIIINSDINDRIPSTSWSSSRSSGIDYLMLDNPYGQEFAKGLTPGSRYLLIGRFDAKSFSFFWLGDFDTIDYCPSFWELDNKPSNYLDTEEFASVRELVEITNNDYRTHDIVYTSDMLSIPRFAQNKMVIYEGRALSKEDEGSNSCIVSLAFMKKNQLKIGDNLIMGLGSKLLEQHGAMGAIACIPERYSPIIKTVELEIVGAYMDTDTNYERSANAYWGYSPNTIFVPSTLLPVEVPKDHSIKPGEFSMVIGSAEDMTPFLKAAQPLASKLGIELLFSDSGWFQISQNIKVSTQASHITLIVFIVASIMTLWLVVYLYIGRNRQQYAIMRALGTSRSRSNRALLLPMGALASIALSLGGVAGLHVVLRSTTSTLKELSSKVTAQYVPDTSLPVRAIVVCFLGQVLVLVLITIVFVTKLNNLKPLALLQGETKARKIKQKALRKYWHSNSSTVNNKESKNAFLIELSTVPPIVDDNIDKSKSSKKSIVLIPNRKSYGALRQSCRYIFRHLRRTIWKTTLILIITTLLPAALGLFAMTMNSYNVLSQTLEVKSYMADIASDQAVEVTTSELVRDTYYRGNIKVYVNNQVALANDMVITNDIDRSLRSSGVTEFMVDYADGYSWNAISGEEAWCLIGEEIASLYNLSPGDEVTLLGMDLLQMMFMMYEPKEVEERIEKRRISYKVAGIVYSDSDVTVDSIFAPSGKNTEEVYGDIFVIDQVELILADNDRVEDMSRLLESIKRKSLRYSQFASYIMDTSRIDDIIGIRNLLHLLFPLVVISIAMIGMVVPFIIIIQSSKEVALLRMLGTTKLRTRCTLIFEQLILCIIGLILAAVYLAHYNLDLLMKTSNVLGWCGGLYLLCYTGSVTISSIIVTRRRVLELLQTKE